MPELGRRKDKWQEENRGERYYGDRIDRTKQLSGYEMRETIKKMFIHKFNVQSLPEFCVVVFLT